MTAKTEATAEQLAKLAALCGKDLSSAVYDAAIGGFRPLSKYWNPFLSISDAFDVVEAMRRREDYTLLLDQTADHYVAEFRGRDGNWWASHEKPETAISLAAIEVLAALDAEEGGR